MTQTLSRYSYSTSTLLVAFVISLSGLVMAQTGPDQTARLDLALKALGSDNPSLALDLLPENEPAKASSYIADQIILTRARAYFQASKLELAEAEYSKISKSSDFWIVALEERAQTRGRMGKFQTVITDLTSIQSPLFDTTRGPETYFVEALSYLKTCQYRKVTEAIDRFKTNVKPRALELTMLSKKGSSEALTKAVSGIKLNGPSTLSYAKVAGQLPERFHLDKIISAEIKKTPGVISKRVSNRIKELAKEDLADITTTTRKLHFVEAEVMQRIAKVSHATGKRSSMGEFKAKGNQLEFPYDGESWLDEIDSYQAQVDGCPEQGANK